MVIFLMTYMCPLPATSPHHQWTGCRSPPGLPGLLSHTVKSLRGHEENAVTGKIVSIVPETLTVESAGIVLIKTYSKSWFLILFTSLGFLIELFQSDVTAKFA